MVILKILKELDLISETISHCHDASWHIWIILNYFDFSELFQIIERPCKVIQGGSRERHCRVDAESVRNARRTLVSVARTARNLLAAAVGCGQSAVFARVDLERFGENTARHVPEMQSKPSQTHKNAPSLPLRTRLSGQTVPKHPEMIHIPENLKIALSRSDAPTLKNFEVFIKNWRK